jgi:lipoprotein LprG
LLICAASLGSGTAACGGGDSGPTIPPDLDGLLSAAAETMGTVDTVSFSMERGGAPIYIDPLETLEFVSAEGRFAAPSSADAVLVVAVGDLRAQVGAVAIDGETWLTNPITGDWEPAPEGYSFDPAALFDPQLGWRPLLADDLTEARLLGLAERNDRTLYHVQGLAPEERISLVTAGLVGQDVTLDLWLDPEDGAVVEAEFVTVYRGEESDWTLTFTDYGADIEIEIPDFDGQG